MVIRFHTIPLQQRSSYCGTFGAILAVAFVVGPLIGGTFAEKVTWRWCFFINLPVGAISLIITFLILYLPNQKLNARASGGMAKLKQLDPIGNLVVSPGIVCPSARITLLLLPCGVLCVTFVAVQIWKQESRTLPPRTVKQRSVAACVWCDFFNGTGMMA
ncbi:hypothetical protein F5882DRAFT_489416 [Hyaloscypha sp. PMI_1271]|nr:hypothetical protein F5882DRAFT_489416 [Hyaloscypha sp. PMI_1271]